MKRNSLLVWLSAVLCMLTSCSSNVELTLTKVEDESKIKQTIKASDFNHYFDVDPDAAIVAYSIENLEDYVLEVTYHKGEVTKTLTDLNLMEVRESSMLVFGFGRDLDSEELIINTVYNTAMEHVDEEISVSEPSSWKVVFPNELYIDGKENVVHLGIIDLTGTGLDETNLQESIANTIKEGMECITITLKKPLV